MKMAFMFLGLCSLSFGWTHVGNNIRGWKKDTVTFYVNSSNCPLSEAEINDIVDVAIDVWNGVTDSKLVVNRSTTTTSVTEFLNGTATDLPIILCDPNFDSQIGSSAVNVVPAATFKTQVDSEGNLVYSGILLNAKSGAAANIGSLTRGQVELTLGHEIGHALGLGHTSIPEALMYYSLGSKERPILTEDDMDGIIHIYPRNELTGGMMGCASVKFNSNHKEPSSYPGLALLILFGVTQIGLGRLISRISIKPEQPL